MNDNGFDETWYFVSVQMSDGRQVRVYAGRDRVVAAVHQNLVEYLFGWPSWVFTEKWRREHPITDRQLPPATAG